MARDAPPLVHVDPATGLPISDDVYPQKVGVIAGDTTTNDGAALAGAIAAAGFGGMVEVLSDTYIGTARIADTSGVQYQGPGRLIYTPDSTRGNRVQNPAGRGGLSWGAEYLYAWLVKFAARTACTVRTTGDSTNDPYSTELAAFLSRYTHVTLTAAGQSGKSTQNWKDTYLASDISAAPTLLIWHYGMNDPFYGRTLTQFRDDLRAGLATYRATVPIGTGSILLLTPNAASDGTNGRDEGWRESARHIVRQAAIDYQCAFLDIYGLYQDGYVGIG